MIAQVRDTIKADSSIGKPESPGIVMDTVGNYEPYVPAKDPMTAVWKSAILPGWGQYYNESYWKIPVFWGIFGWLTYNYVLNNNNYSDYKGLYIQSNFSIESYRRLRDFYRDQRDLFVIYIGIAYLANLLDAYVDASLFDFDVSQNFNTGSRQLNFKFKF
ncbi:hypothetical protein MASR1M107_06750 [Ignavibacteriales bacterium]